MTRRALRRGFWTDSESNYHAFLEFVSCESSLRLCSSQWPVAGGR
jgi:hypothetical protein